MARESRDISGKQAEQKYDIIYDMGKKAKSLVVAALAIAGAMSVPLRFAASACNPTPPMARRLHNRSSTRPLHSHVARSASRRGGDEERRVQAPEGGCGGAMTGTLIHAIRVHIKA